LESVIKTLWVHKLWFAKPTNPQGVPHNPQT